MSKTRKVLLTLLALSLLTGPMRLLLAAMLPDSTVNPVPGCIAGMLLSLLTLGLPAWLLRPWTSPRLLMEKSVWPGAAMGALAAMLIRWGFPMLDHAWQMVLGLTPAQMPTPESVPLAMLYVAALVIVPALTEEAFFRGALLTGMLDGSRRIAAVALTTLTFALVHGNLANLPSLLALSLMLTMLMLHTGHIVVPVAVHLVYNLTALGWPVLPEWLGGMCCGAAVTLCGYMMLCQPNIAHPPMKIADGLIAALTMATLLILTLI